VGDFVVFLEDGHEIVGILFAYVFDAEIVHTKGEADGTPFVSPQSASELALFVTVFVESF
jgi:hypothetical protein